MFLIFNVLTQQVEEDKKKAVATEIVEGKKETQNQPGAAYLVCFVVLIKPFKIV